MLLRLGLGFRSGWEPTSANSTTHHASSILLLLLLVDAVPSSGARHKLHSVHLLLLVFLLLICRRCFAETAAERISFEEIMEIAAEELERLGHPAPQPS